jgi:hypothetical protein
MTGDGEAVGCNKQPAFEAIYGLAQDRDGIVWTAPLSFITRNAKAKVLDRTDEKLDKISSTVEVGFETAWRDGQKFHSDATTFDPLIVDNYSIVEPQQWIYPCKKKVDVKDTEPSQPCLKGNINAFSGAMISNSCTKYPCEEGTFWITALVTERDAYRMTEYLMNLSDSMDKNKDKGKDIVKKATTSEKKDETKSP